MVVVKRSTAVVVAVGLTLAVGASGLLSGTGGSERTNTRASEASRSTALRLSDDLSTRVARARVHATWRSVRRGLIDLFAKSARERSALAVLNAATLSDEDGLREALHEALPRWLAQDEEAARAWLLRSMATRPLSVVLVLLSETATLDPELALQLAQQLAPDARPHALREIFNTWAEVAPEQAARAAAELPESAGQAPALGEVARVWAEQAPAEAEAWASALPTHEARREALVPIVDSLAAEDPKQAAAALARLPEEGYTPQLAETVAAEWVRTDPVEARSWVETLTPALRAGAVSALLAGLLQSDAQRAANWARELQSNEQSPVVENTLSMWVARDPNAALAWVIRLPERSERGGLLVLALDRFRLQDGPGAERWLAVHSQGFTSQPRR
jgi:hypothetical protein